MLTTTYYVSKLNNGCTFFGTLSSIERIAKGIKPLLLKKLLQNPLMEINYSLKLNFNLYKEIIMIILTIFTISAICLMISLLLAMVFNDLEVYSQKRYPQILFSVLKYICFISAIVCIITLIINIVI